MAALGQLINRYIAACLTLPLVGRLLRVTKRRLRPLGARTAIDLPESLVPDREYASIWWGFYEAAERRLVSKFLATGDQVVELGASVGVVSLAIARAIGPTGRLTSVEARPDLALVAQNNVRNNWPQIDYRSVAGVVDCSTGARARATSGFVLLGTNTSGRLAEAGETNSDQYPTVRISDLRLEASRRAVLVCDIEGAEAGVLITEAEWLKLFKLLIIEFHETWFEGQRYQITALVRLATESGFSLIERDGNVFVFERY